MSWVVALHKHGRWGEIVNGTRATITEVDREAVTITVRTTRAPSSVGGLQPWARRLAAQHSELVAQDEDLQFLGGLAMGDQARSWMERQSVR